MAMSRKQFVSLANILSAAHANYADDIKETQIVDSITKDIADMCQYENSNFDRQRFYAAADYRAEG